MATGDCREPSLHRSLRDLFEKEGLESPEVVILGGVFTYPFHEGWFHTRHRPEPGTCQAGQHAGASGHRQRNDYELLRLEIIGSAAKSVGKAFADNVRMSSTGRPVRHGATPLVLLAVVLAIVRDRFLAVREVFECDLQIS